jgi:hypothetical protein
MMILSKMSPNAAKDNLLCTLALCHKCFIYFISGKFSFLSLFPHSGIFSNCRLLFLDFQEALQITKKTRNPVQEREVLPDLPSLQDLVAMKDPRL